jgi:hypothetical protein
MVYAMLLTRVSALKKEKGLELQGRIEPNSGRETYSRSREPEITLGCEPRGLDEPAGPGYYLILLRQHHANSRRRWYRRVFVISE